MSDKKVPYGRLKAYYASSGIKHSDEANRLGITVSTFSRKINRANADFTREEVANICKEHSLDANLFFLD